MDVKGSSILGIKYFVGSFQNRTIFNYEFLNGPEFAHDYRIVKYLLGIN